MGARVVCCATAAVLGLVLGACAHDAPSSAGGSTTIATTSLPAPAPTSLVHTSTGVHPTVAPASFPDSQQEYTSTLVRAWGRGDRGTAGYYTTAAALTKMFEGLDRGGPGWSLIGCDNAGPRPACTFIEREQEKRLVLFYDAYKLGQPGAVLDLEFISDIPAPATT